MCQRQRSNKLTDSPVLTLNRTCGGQQAPSCCPFTSNILDAFTRDPASFQAHYSRLASLTPVYHARGYVIYVRSSRSRPRILVRHSLHQHTRGTGSEALYLLFGGACRNRKPHPRGTGVLKARQSAILRIVGRPVGPWLA